MAGFSAAWLVAGAGDRTSGAAAGWGRWKWPLLFTATGLAADLDLLAGTHHAASHSVGAAGLVFLSALAILGPRRWRLAAACGAAYASHIVLDLLAEDSSPPLGLMALWPFDTGYYQFPFDLFMGISRQYWNPVAWLQNARSVALELVLLAPVVALVCRYRGWPGFRDRHR
jgi:membrane-bound metal-dependent hydrolase YbcI (DUF457 family)